MQPLVLTATTIISPIGRGAAMTLAALRSRCHGLSPCDFADVTDGYIGRVAAVDTHVLPPGLAHFDCRNNRLADLALRTDDFAHAVILSHGSASPRPGLERARGEVRTISLPGHVCPLRGLVGSTAPVVSFGQRGSQCRGG